MTAMESGEMFFASLTRNIIMPKMYKLLAGHVDAIIASGGQVSGKSLMENMDRTLTDMCAYLKIVDYHGPVQTSTSVRTPLTFSESTTTAKKPAKPKAAPTPKTGDPLMSQGGSRCQHRFLREPKKGQQCDNYAIAETDWKYCRHCKDRKTHAPKEEDVGKNVTTKFVSSEPQIELTFEEPTQCYITPEGFRVKMELSKKVVQGFGPTMQPLNDEQKQLARNVGYKLKEDGVSSSTGQPSSYSMPSFTASSNDGSQFGFTGMQFTGTPF